MSSSMAKQLINMKGKEIIKKILSGERKFSGIKLEEGFNLSGHEDFGEIQEYLRRQELSKNPLNITDSEFRFVIANGIYLPYTLGKRANLGGANLGGANLERAYLWKANLGRANLGGANLERANLWKANLGGANLERAYLWEANLWEAKLWEANLWKANLGGANLERAYLWGANLDRANLWKANLERAYLGNILNLETAINLNRAHFFETRVTKKEEAIIKEALRQTKLLIVEQI